MTLTEIRARALAQAGEQEGALGDMDSVLTAYVDEGVRALCPEGLPQTCQVTVQNGTAALPEGTARVIRVTDPMGRVKEIYRFQDGALCIAPDGVYTVRVMVLPGAVTETQIGLPAEFHGALSDYATWRLLSNGGRTQQVRADFYRQSWQNAAAQIGRRIDRMCGPLRRVNRYA